MAANIAEGFAQRSQAEKAPVLNGAEGSVEESRYFLILAQDLGYGQTPDLMRLLEEVSRLLNAYTRTLLAPGFRIPKGYQGRSPWLVSSTLERTGQRCESQATDTCMV